MGVIDSLVRPESNSRDVNAISTDVPAEAGIAVTGVYLWGAMIVLARYRRVLAASRRAWPLLVFAALAPISAAWSLDPALTVRRGVLVMTSTVFAIYLGDP